MTPEPPSSRTHDPDFYGSQRRGRRRDVSAAPFRDTVFAMVRSIPFGRATSYGGVAALLGAPRAARGVGNALSSLAAGTDVPWWRVVNRNGEITIKGVPGLPALQRALLESEGVVFDGHGRVDLDRSGWDPDHPSAP